MEATETSPSSSTLLNGPETPKGLGRGNSDTLELRGLGALPAPKRERLRYYSKLYIGFLRYPRRFINYLRARKAERTEYLSYLPTRLDVEPASRCNFHCTMCPVSDWPKYKRADDMSFEQFKKLIDSQYGVYEMKLQGLGEPLLARDTFFQMLRYACSKHIWVRVTTNGSLLHQHDNYKKIIDAGTGEVQVSFDGATKETFEKIRRGSVFERVVENCKLLNGYCDDKGIVRTRAWILVQKDNIHEFFDFIPKAVEMGFKRMTYALYLSGWGDEKWLETTTGLQVQSRMTREMALQAMEIGKQKGIEVTFYSGETAYSAESLDTLCYWPFSRAYVSSDMRIVPCCLIANPDFCEIGDANNFTESWNGPLFREFRRAHIEGRIPKPCQDCYQQAPTKTAALNIVQ